MTRSIYQRLIRRYNPSSLEERRRFLKSIAALGAVSLLSNQVDRAWASKIQRRVIVIGAGFAGLACAHELKMAGLAVNVMEARNRVGGRVVSFDDFIPNQVIEGGGEFIGENHPTWWAYQEKFGLSISKIPDDEELEMPIYLDGRLLDYQAGDRLYRRMERAFSELNALASTIDEEQPWFSRSAIELDQRSIADWLVGLKVADQVRKLAAIQMSSDNAVPNNQASLLGMLAAVKGGGVEKFWELSETHRCTNGNQQLAHELAKAIGDEQIHLNQPVRSIDSSGPIVKVITADDRLWECDDVVLATPPSTWSKIQFTPSLPVELNPQMGNAVKYLANVKQHFWLDDQVSADSLTDGPISQTWDTTSCHPERSSSACLVAFSGGSQADACLNFAKEQRDRVYREEFNKIYPKFADNFVASRMMDWPREPWTMAGYSFPAPGQVTTQGPILDAGIENLHFCGEYACYKFIGYMEGALNSGAALAKRIEQRQ